MLKETRYGLWLVTAMVVCSSLWAQTAETDGQQSPGQSVSGGSINNNIATAPGNSLFSIRHIYITGNKKTKASIILREIPFKAGEQYPLNELVKKFEDAQRQLLNTALFHEVIVALKSFVGYDVDILIDVKERWYLFPVPYFKIIDRNLNQWLVQQKASFDRINYGAKLMYYNVTGHNDKFRLWLISGYTKQFSFNYERPYFDKNMKWGFTTGFAIGKNREVNYNTINDKQVFLKDNDNYIRNFIHADAELTYRRAIKTRHTFGIAYNVEGVSDTIVALNPTYFKSGRNRIQYPEIYYDMTYYDLDYIPYPTKGYAAEITVDKSGFNNIINVWQLAVKGAGNWHVAPKAFFTISAYGTIKAPFKQPYYTQRLLGYSDQFMQGYEYYVIDGVAGWYTKATLTRELVNIKFKLPPHKGKELPSVPIRIYGKIYGNAGYVYNPQPGENSLSNTMLYSGGFGLDIISIYDFTVKLEWSFNQLGQNGIFLHRRSVF